MKRVLSGKIKGRQPEKRRRRKITKKNKGKLQGAGIKSL